MRFDPSHPSLVRCRCAVSALFVAVLWFAGACSLATSLDGLAGQRPPDKPDGAADVASELSDASEAHEADSSVDDEAGADAASDSATDTPDGGKLDPNLVCMEDAKVFCSRLLECGGPFAVTVLYGTETNCKSVIWNGCMGRMQAAGSGATPEQAMKCTQDELAATCRDLLAFHWPASCAPIPGSLPDGAGCWSSWQCSVGHCTVEPGTMCGVCAAALHEGQVCQHSGQCDWNYNCHAGHCRRLAREGEACSSSQPCGLGLVCDTNVCVAASGLGEPCDPLLPLGTCDALRGLYCSSSSTCEQGETTGAGAPCGIVNGKVVWCEQAAVCQWVNNGLKCTLAAPGQPCEFDGGVRWPCSAPSVCYQGACALPNADSCL